MIDWITWLAYFTKRGRLRDHEDAVFAIYKGVIGDDNNTNQEFREMDNQEEDEEAKQWRL